MRAFRSSLIAFVAVGCLLACRGASAITIALDYSNDTFFNNPAHAAAKASLQAAADYVGSLITTQLGATTDTSIGTSGNSSATFDFSLSYKNPNNGTTQITYNPVVVPQNQVTIFVGVQNLAGSTLGQGGPGGFGFTSTGSVSDLQSFGTAVQNAQTAGNANMGRGGGPTIGHLSGSYSVTVNNNTTNYPYTVNFGSSIGNLWFDVDTDNNGVADSDATLNNYWQFDHTQPVPFAKYDFYSVAEHEIIHALGFSSSETYTSKISASDPKDWTGSNVISLLGTGDNVLAPDSNHVAEGLLSKRLTDGQTQEALMDPTLTNGQRKTVTRLDLAFLRDIGWQTVAIPNVLGDFNQDSVRTSADLPVMLQALTNLSTYETNYGVQPANLLSVADINGDHAFTNADLQAMIALLLSDGASPAPSLQSVPEPGSLLLMALGAGLLGCRRRKSRST